MEARLKENGLGGTVTYYDQGYSDIVESLDGYTRVSRTVLWVGLALWVVVLAAYCVLFPLQEGKTALRMWTLGTVKRDITGSIWLSSAAVAVIGTVIALAVSIPGMSWAIGKLKELTGSELAMSVSPWQTAALRRGAGPGAGSAVGPVQRPAASPGHPQGSVKHRRERSDDPYFFQANARDRSVPGGGADGPGVFPGPVYAPAVPGPDGRTH